MSSFLLLRVYFGISLICTLVIALIGVKYFIVPAIDAGTTDKELSYILQVLGYCTIFIVMGISYVTLFSTPLMKEKVRGRVEAVLATPTKPKTLWIGKTIALFIPGLIMGLLFTAVLTRAIYYLCMAPDYKFVFDFWLTITSYVVIPVVYFTMSLIMNLIGLCGRVLDAAVIGIIFVAGVITVMINLAARDIVDARTWLFMLINLGIGLLFALCSIHFKHFLQKERIVISCRK